MEKKEFLILRRRFEEVCFPFHHPTVCYLLKNYGTKIRRGNIICKYFNKKSKTLHFRQRCRSFSNELATTLIHSSHRGIIRCTTAQFEVLGRVA